MSWLRERRPPEPGRRAICHGDFHPQNILSEGGAVTGVLDWPNALVADPTYDVASTRIILASDADRAVGSAGRARGVASFVRLMLVKRYLAGIRRRRPLDPGGARPTTRAANAMRGLVRTGEHRRRRASSAASPLDASAFGDILAEALRSRHRRPSDTSPAGRADPFGSQPGTSVPRAGLSDRDRDLTLGGELWRR